MLNNYIKPSSNLASSLIMLFSQITRIEYIHSRDFVHRDIKPANFVVPKLAADASGSDVVVNVIDFGLA